MQSKLQSKLELFDIKLQKELKIQLDRAHDGGLKRTHYVKAKHLYTNQWIKARILATRLSKSITLLRNFYEISSFFSITNVDSNTVTQKSSNSYEYYIHFEDIDKRNDCWLPFKELKQTKEEIIDKKMDQLSVENLHPNDNPHYGLSLTQLQIHEELTKIKCIEKIRLGIFQGDAWYFSPYPPQYHNIEMLYLCQFCLSFFAKQSELIRHDKICSLFHPPGDEIYRDEEKMIAIFEIDGQKNPVYCENLGYLSKLFLDHKNLTLDMSIFLFYVLCEIYDNEYHIAGYFSKVKQSINNLSCILVLPFYQRKGYGKFLINFSYELSLIEGKVGGPEKPLSDLGRETYLSLWTQRIVQIISQNTSENISLELISKKTAITEDDIKWTLTKCNLIKLVNGEAVICVNQENLTKLRKKDGKSAPLVIRDKIHYVPFQKSWEFDQNSGENLK